MKALRYVLLFLGHLWALPHTLFGVLLLLTVYWPKSVRWRDGALEVVVKRHLIPQGFDQTGDGDVDDPEDWVTGAQTHGGIIFSCDEENRDSFRVRNHERTHVVQAMVLGGVLYPLLWGLNFLVNVIAERSTETAYSGIWFERQARAHENRLPWVMR